MSDNLFQKLEEKMMVLLSEVEDLRKEVQFLKQENAAMKYEKENQMRKLQDLVSLLDTVALPEQILPPIAKPVLVQGG